MSIIEIIIIIRVINYITDYCISVFLVSLPVWYAQYGRGSGPIFLDLVRCVGTESRLIDCQYDPNASEDSHAEDAGVVCFNGTG